MTKTILVADDSKTIRHVVNLTFHSTGYRIVPVASAQEAVDRLHTERADLVLADVGMPGVDGYQLCEQLKRDARTQHIPVLLMAGAFEPFDERRAQSAHADGHIKKPFDTTTLLDQVNRLTGQRADSPQPLSFAESLAARGSQPAPTNGGGAPEPAARPAPASPFGPPPREAPPAREAPRPMAARPPPEPEPVYEDVSDDEPIAAHGGFGGPSLEPPSPPSPEEAARRKAVDMWALSDESHAPRRAAAHHSEPVEEVELSSPPARSAAMRGAVHAVADRAAPALATAVAASAPGLSRDELLALAQKTIEQIAWEVVPELAETIIREEIRRLLQDR